MGELDDLALRSAVLKVLGDRVRTAYNQAKDACAAVLGPEGRKTAVLAGNKIASVSVSKTGRVTIDETRLATWVAEHYPTEVELRPVVRPAFLAEIKKATIQAGEPAMPDGTLDVPGIAIGESYVTVYPAAGADELVQRLWDSGALDLDMASGHLELEGPA